MPDGDSPLRIKAQALEKELIRLNERIARLAMPLGVPLETELDLQRLLDHGSNLFPSTSDQIGSDQQRRKRNELEELRGLLVMRCELLTTMLQDLGLDVTYQITAAVEEWLQRQGFKPGADGFVLLKHLREVKSSHPG